MLGLGHDVVNVPAFAEQLGEPGSRMRNLFSMRELWQTAQRVQVKRDGEAVHLAARWAGKGAQGEVRSDFTQGKCRWRHCLSVHARRFSLGAHRNT